MSARLLPPLSVFVNRAARANVRPLVAMLALGLLVYAATMFLLAPSSVMDAYADPALIVQRPSTWPNGEGRATLHRIARPGELAIRVAHATPSGDETLYVLPEAIASDEISAFEQDGTVEGGTPTITRFRIRNFHARSDHERLAVVVGSQAVQIAEAVGASGLWQMVEPLPILEQNFVEASLRDGVETIER